MACLQIRNRLTTVAAFVARNLRTPSCVPFCFIHSHCSFSHWSTISQTVCHWNRTSILLINHLHECEYYHTGSQAKPLADISQIDLDSNNMDDRDSVSVEDRVNASEILKNLSPEEEKKLKLIKLEFDVYKEMNAKVPEMMTDENWLHALQLEKSQRFNYYRFLVRKENYSKQKKLKQKAKQEEEEEQQTTEETAKNVEEKKSPKNTMFLIVRDSTIKTVGNSRLARAMLFGQPLVIDMGYEQYMRPQDCQSLVTQLREGFFRNRNYLDPFHLIFTSLNPSGVLLSKMKQQLLCGQNFLSTMTDESYMDLFPHEKLVYLTPHARDELKQVSYNDIYIVGGFVDKTCQKPVSLARAKEQGIRTAKFPLDRYLLWGSGAGKSLAIDQVLAIMLEQRQSNDWKKALKHIPHRKLKRDDV